MQSNISHGVVVLNMKSESNSIRNDFVRIVGIIVIYNNYSYPGVVRVVFRVRLSVLEG